MNIRNIFEKLELELITEKKTEKGDIPKAGSDARGKLHELLVGYHLNGGRHMEKFKDKDGESPEEAHNRIKSKIHPKEYERISHAAKLAAEHIRKTHLSGKHVKTRWTSKAGDIERATGIPSSQKEDASDLVVTTRHRGKIRHHGISLKASDKVPGSHHVGTSNPGLEITYGGQALFDRHKKAILKAHPQLAKMKNSEQRKAWMKANPKKAAKIRESNRKTLHAIAKHTAEYLNEQGTKFIADHIATHILKTHQTPMERMGHAHIRHTSYLDKGQRAHHSITPSTHWEKLLKDHKNLRVEQRGTTLQFSHKDHGVFATHRMKFESQSDPLGTIKGFGNSHGNYEPSKREKRKAKTKRATKRALRNRKSRKKSKLKEYVDTLISNILNETLIHRSLYNG